MLLYRYKMRFYTFTLQALLTGIITGYLALTAIYLIPKNNVLAILILISIITFDYFFIKRLLKSRKGQSFSVTELDAAMTNVTLVLLTIILGLFIQVVQLKSAKNYEKEELEILKQIRDKL